MHIIIVQDGHQMVGKPALAERVMRAKFKDVEISVYTNVEAAKKAFRSSQSYDLAIIDEKLPLADGQMPQAEAGGELIDFMRGSKFTCKHLPVILTSQDTVASFDRATDIAFSRTGVMPAKPEEMMSWLQNPLSNQQANFGRLVETALAYGREFIRGKQEAAASRPSRPVPMHSSLILDQHKAKCI